MRRPKPKLTIDTSVASRSNGDEERNRTPASSSSSSATTPLRNLFRTSSLSKLIKGRPATPQPSLHRSHSSSSLSPPSPTTTTTTPPQTTTTLQEPIESSKKLKKRKILQLGVNWGGKTTIFKSIKVLFSNGYTDPERTSYRDIIFSNILYSTRCLIEYALQDDSISESDKKFIRDYGSPILDMFADFTIERNVLHLVPELWKHHAIQKAYEERNRYFHIPEVSYWMNDMERVLNPSFTPTTADVIRSRVKTTGIVYTTFTYNNYEISDIDVGSERNERKKWYSCFEEVTDLMYVVALDEYSNFCYEDNETNRLRESLNCWLEVANSHFFSPSAVNIFLVFNKADLFKEKIEKGCHLENYFPAYNGGDDPNKALSFIVDMFLKRIRDKRKIHVCVTNALDLDCMRRFWKCVVSVPTLPEIMDGKSNSSSTPPALDSQQRHATLQEDDFMLKEEWCWHLRQESSSCLKYDTSSGSLLEDYSPFSYSDANVYTTSYPVAYSDCYVDNLSIGFHSDISLVTRDKPNVHLQAHSYILSVRSPKFFKAIIDLKASNESLRRVETASFRNVSYGIVVVDFLSHTTLKHILSLVYNNTFYPYLSCRDDKVDLEIVLQLNREFDLTDKSEGELCDLYARQFPCDINLSSMSEAKSPIKKLTSQIKKRGVKAIKKKLLRRSTSSSTEVDSTLFVSSDFSPSQPKLESNLTESISKNRMNDLALAFLKLNYGDVKFNYDLHLYGVDPAHGNAIKTHKFICYEHLPNHNSEADSYVTYPFFSFESYLHALSYMYCGGGHMHPALVPMNLSLSDLLNCMHISRLWNFDRDDMYFKSLVIQLAKLLTVQNVCHVLKHFEEDELKFNEYNNRPSSSMFIQDSLLSRLPSEIHFLVLSFISTPPVIEQQAIDQRVINQDTLTYLLFTSDDFISYMQQYYPCYLYCKTPNMAAYAAVRSLCSDFISNNFKQVQLQPSWSEISDATKSKILTDVYQTTIVTVV